MTINDINLTGVKQKYPELAFEYPENMTPEEYRKARLNANKKSEGFYKEFLESLPRKTKRQKAMTTAYERLLTDLLPGAIQFMIETYYYGVNDKEFLLSEAKRHAEGEAYMFVFEWKQYDN